MVSLSQGRDLKGRLVFLLIVLCIYVGAWFIRQQLFLNWDVSWLVHAAMRLIAGGTYTKDFFSPNPPMILYLYMPPIFVSKILGLNSISVFNSYIFVLATLSFFLCYQLTKKIFAPEESLFRRLFLVAMLFVFLVMPVSSFGQREHLFVLLTMPYFLAVVCRLNGCEITNTISVVVGLLAGIAVAMKPQFLIAPVLVESYLCLCQRRWLAWVRVETVCLIGLCLLYCIGIYLFYPDYVFVILPTVLRYYHENMRSPFSVLFFAILFWCFPLVLYWAQYHVNTYRALSAVLLLALIGSLLAYYSQGALLSYHLLPISSYAFLLFLLLYWLQITQPSSDWRSLVKLALFTISIFAYYFYRFHTMYLLALFDPVLFFGFFAILFSVILCATPSAKNIWKIPCAVAVIIVVSVVVYHMIFAILGLNSGILLVVCMLFALFFVFAGKNWRDIFRYAYIVVLGVLLFAAPAASLRADYLSARLYKDHFLQQMIAFMQTQAPHQTIYALSSAGSVSFPLVDYVSADSAQRFDCLWMFNRLPWLISQKGYDAVMRSLNSTNGKFFLTMIAEDLHDHQPDIVFVDINTDNVDSNGARMTFDYLDFLRRYPLFDTEWKHYRYLTTIENHSAFDKFKIAVYKREKN